MKPVLICVILLASVVSTGMTADIPPGKPIVVDYDSTVETTGFSMVIQADQPVFAKKFKVTYLITYNEMTLSDAAVRETEIRKRYSDACKVDVKVEEVVWSDISSVLDLNN